MSINYSQPDGYDQFAPHRDVARYREPQPNGRPPVEPHPAGSIQADTPLSTAITGGAPQYPVDPHMSDWVQRQPGPQPPLAPSAPSAAPTDPTAGMSAGQSGAFRNFTSAAFDSHKLDDPNHNSVKYVAARVFQNYAPTSENLPKVVADLRAQGHNATQVGKDSIDMNDGYGPIDVILGAGGGGNRGWQWNPRGNGQPTSATGGINPLMAAIQPGHNSNQQLYQLLAQQLLAPTSAV